MTTTPKRTRHGVEAAAEEVEATHDDPVKAPEEEAPPTASETTGVSGKVCVNCGNPAVYRTIGQGADEVYFCEKDRPPSEPVERLDG